MNNKFIPLSVPNIRGNELDYVTKVINEEWVSTAGNSIVEFEKKFSDYLNISFACACQSGTSGLHLCLRHYNIGTNDVVLVPTLTFIATINAVTYQNARPVFFDCDEHLCINVEQVRHYVDHECYFSDSVLYDKQLGLPVKAIIPVHVFGDTCQIQSLMEIAEQYNLIVIEDATESLGTRFQDGKYKNKYTGTVGHSGVFSFNGNKIITTGGGGMIVSHDQKAIEHMRYLSQQSKDDAVYFVHNEIGYNYRMTNIQAALGLGQLEQLNSFIESKRNNYKLYKELLMNCTYGKLLNFYANMDANYWFYSFAINSSSASIRDNLIKYLNDNRIQARPIWKLNHTQKPFLNFKSMQCPNADLYYNQIVNLPCSSNLTPDDVKIVCDVLMAFQP